MDIVTIILLRFKRFWRDIGGATAIEYGLVIALLAVVLVAALTLTGQSTRSLFEGVSGAVGPSARAPDFVIPPRRLPQNPDHPTLWAIPFHANALPEGFPDIGGQEFSITGGGNPRMLIAGADPRVISGTNNPQFDTENYASSGTGFGSGGFHRILIDTPPENTTYTVNLNVNGQTIQYQFTNTPY